MKIIKSKTLNLIQGVNIVVSMDVNEINNSLKILKGFYYNYILCKNNNILYVGYSSNVYYRLVQHKNTKHFNKVILIELRNEHFARKLERDLINKIKPKSNYQFAK
jgi:hypothetical protein